MMQPKWKVWDAWNGSEEEAVDRLGVSDDGVGLVRELDRELATRVESILNEWLSTARGELAEQWS